MTLHESELRPSIGTEGPASPVAQRFSVTPASWLLLAADIQASPQCLGAWPKPTASQVFPMLFHD